MRNFFDALFACNFHGEQRILGTCAQLIDGVFIKAFDFQHLLQWHIRHFFETGETFFNQDVSHFLVHVQLGHEQFTDAEGFVSLLLSRLSRIHDVDFPAGQFSCQTHVLAAATDGDGEVFFVHHHIHGVTLFVHHDGADVGRCQSANHKLSWVFTPQHDVHALASELGGHGIHASATHANASTDRVHAFVVRDHSDLGA